MDGHDESSQESRDKINSSDVPSQKNDRNDIQNGKDNTISEVHEIASDIDDCVIEEKQAKPPVVETPVQLRRSSRAIKRKRYDDELENGDVISDLEDCYVNESHKRRSKAIVINDTKTLVEMAAKQMRSGIQKKEPTVVIIDTNSMPANKGYNSTIKKNNTNFNNSLSAQSLYQSIVARGTTVTPVSSKTSQNSHNSHNSQQSIILPSLTDDMYVVEAPSFIVPYVYEKPSLKPFRKFVDNLANELKEQTAKEEEEKEKEKEVNKKDDKEIESKEDKTDKEGVDESDDEKETVAKSKEEQAEDSKQKKKEERKGNKSVFQLV